MATRAGRVGFCGRKLKDGMVSIDIDPVILEIGPLAVRWYGLMYAVGILVGLYVAMPYALQKGLKEEDIWKVFWPAAVAAFLGGRLYFVLQQDLGPYLAQPWRILATWEGGMAFYGAIFGGLAAIVVTCRVYRVPLWPLLDAAALFATVGQAFGRIGNLINGDIVGYPTTSPWGVVYPRSPFVASPTTAYEPAAAYELLFNLALFFILWNVRFRLRPDGLVCALYLILYAVGQFGLFFGRDNVVVWMGLKQAQVTSLVVLPFALGIFYWRWRQRMGADVPAGRREA